MSELIKIAVDAMGGDNSPQKIIDGIVHNHKKNPDNFYKIFGDQNEILKFLNNRIDKNFYNIVHTNNFVKSTDSPLEAAKKVRTQVCGLPLKVSKKKKLILLFQQVIQAHYL